MHPTQSPEALIQERNRRTNFYKHKRLIRIAHQRSYEKLKQEIANLPTLYELSGRMNYSDYLDLPRHRGDNIFQAIFSHSKLKDSEKRDLILLLLLQGGYEYFYKQVVNDKIMDLFLENKADLKVLYIGLLNCNVYPVLDLKIKEKIWNAIIADNIFDCRDIFYGLVSCTSTDLRNFQEFTTFWFNQIKSEAEVVSAANDIKLALANTELDYYKYLQQIAEVRIVSLREHRDQSTAESKHDKEMVSRFFNKSHNLFARCFTSDKPYDVYKRKYKHPSITVKEPLEDLRKHAEEKINDRLRKDSLPSIRLNIR